MTDRELLIKLRRGQKVVFAQGEPYVSDERPHIAIVGKVDEKYLRLKHCGFERMGSLYWYEHLQGKVLCADEGDNAMKHTLYSAVDAYNEMMSEINAAKKKYTQRLAEITAHIKGE